MPHAESFDAIVLKTYDVGEADRLCVLFTRERGRILARASGARRLTSRLGASLLPFCRVQVELKESSAGWVVAGAVTSEGLQRLRGFQGQVVAEFMMLEEGVELLMRLVTDEGALPEVFAVTENFFAACRQSQPHAALAYAFALLHALGLLPGEEEAQALQPLLPAELAFVRLCRDGEITTPDPSCRIPVLSALRSTLLQEYVHNPLKAVAIGQQMR
jgi:DNA repair protein RecO